ncbi:hypothetical protein [Rhodanobacter denitrificans]|uniref:hypothetical protein n=1 Tax=Rhodanobacter denitrificans TaxID=666685 RepID=UPI00091E8535|nr:hypothetical protein [Rhodanobacter denitrificans]UJJ53032.1 hypothetical protein LRK52_18160 [Rhodanobacter denitrificans]
MNRFEQAVTDAGLTLPDKSDPLYRAILITETMRQSNYRDHVFEPDKYAAIIGAVFAHIQAGDDDVQASATACVLMRPSKMREEATRGTLPPTQNPDSDVAREGAESSNEET